MSAQALKYGQPRKEGAGVSEAAEEAAAPAKTGKTRKPSRRLYEPAAIEDAKARRRFSAELKKVG